MAGFCDLHKFKLCTKDDDGFANMHEVCTVLNQNQGMLMHLTLSAYLLHHHSWDPASQSTMVWQLMHLNLMDTRISHLVLMHITHAQNLWVLTLHRTFECPGTVGVVFGSNHIVEGQHTILPHLAAFRFIMVGHNYETSLTQSIVL